MAASVAVRSGWRLRSSAEEALALFGFKRRTSAIGARLEAARERGDVPRPPSSSAKPDSIEAGLMNA